MSHSTSMIHTLVRTCILTDFTTIGVPYRASTIHTLLRACAIADFATLGVPYCAFRKTKG